MLICQNLAAKFCDFGVSEKIEGDGMISKTAGTYHFFAPECCDPDVDVFLGTATDMWSLGVTLFCMIFN